MTPPDALVQPTFTPERSYTTWGELFDYSVDVEGALDACNRDKQSIRQWMREQ